MGLIEYTKGIEDILQSNDEWKSRYDGYLRGLNNHRMMQKKCRGLFRMWKPLSCYSSIGKATQSKGEFDIRYLGQSVATICISKDDKVICSPKTKNNLKYFGCDISGEFEWSSIEGTNFRRTFKSFNTDIVKTKSPEHRAENMLLEYFSLTSAKNKPLLNIQPVKLGGGFFQMPTPLKASTGQVEYSESRVGGGIDIMSRVILNTGDPRLTIFELKDENAKNEPPTKVIKQAIAYAVFMAYLLNHNENWWKELGFGKAPKDKVINVATLMPPSEKQGSRGYESVSIELTNGFILELHSLYFNNGEFTGSLPQIMKK